MCNLHKKPTINYIMSKAARGKSFTTSELVESLLEIIKDILPVHPNEWEEVLACHETRYPDMLDRTKESIKCKFSSLYNAKKPTGDPTCPHNSKKHREDL